MSSLFSLALLALGLAAPAIAQAPITFQYFYDDIAQLVKVVDSTGVAVDYVYDAVGNMLEVKRSTLANPGGLQIFGFTPQQGGPLATVTIQGLGFSPAPANNLVKFNGTAANVLSATGTMLVVTVPANATTGPISAMVGTSTATSSTNFTTVPLPAITSISPKAGLPNTTLTNFQAKGINLTGSTFGFVPALNPAAITIGSVSISPGGSSATLSITINAKAAGAFTLVATNASGSSGAFPSPANTLSIVVNPEADSDGDGFPDGLELLFGSDPTDPSSTPDLTSQGDVLGPAFSVLNGVGPFTDLPTQHDLLGPAFSVLNSTVPFTGMPTQQDLLGPAFSVLNGIGTGPTTITQSKKEPNAKFLKNGQKPTEEKNSSPPDTKPPVVSITQPLDGVTLVEGQTLKVLVNATGDLEVRQVELRVNGVAFSTDSTSPYELTFTVPAGVTTLTFSAPATDAEGKTASSSDVTVSVTKDSFATVEGRVTDLSGNPVSAANVELLVNGLLAEFFDFDTPLTTLPDLQGRTANRTVLVSAINIRNPYEVFGPDPFGVEMSPDYAARLTGWIRIAQAGTYTFFLGADEGARLALDGKTVVDIPTGRGEFLEGSATVSLRPGLIPIEVSYHESVGKAELQLSFRSPDGERQVIPPALLVPKTAPIIATTDRFGEFSFKAVPTAVDLQIRANIRINGKTLTGRSKTVSGGSKDRVRVGDIVVTRPR